MKLYSVLYKLFAPFVRFLFNIHVHGEENIPKEGGLLICPNHISNCDVVILGAATRTRQIRFMAKSELFRIPLLKQLISALGAFPVKRGEGDVTAVKKTIKLLKENQTVGMFPQGKRYVGQDPAQTEIKHGAGLVAFRAGVAVLPAAIKTKNYRIVPFRRVDVIFGKPILFDEFNFTSGNRNEFISASEKIFDSVKALLKEDIKNS